MRVKRMQSFENDENPQPSDAHHPEKGNKKKLKLKKKEKLKSSTSGGGGGGAPEEKKQYYKIEIRKLPITDYKEHDFAQNIELVLKGLNIPQEDVQILHFMEGKLRSVLPPLPLPPPPLTDL